MKRYAVLLILFATLVTTARADEASKKAKVEELIGVMHMDRTMAQMMDAVTTQMHQAVEQTTPGMDTLTDAQKKMLNDFEAQVMQVVGASLSFKAMEPDFVKLYMDNFSEDEVDGMLAFYKSPVGQSVLEKMPVMMNQSMLIAQKRLVDVEPKLKALQEQFMEQMKDYSAPKN